MKVVERLVMLLVAIVVADPALAGLLQVDCTKGETLTKAVEQAQPGDTIQVTGTCKETVMITTDRVTLDGQGRAILDGGGVGAGGTVVSTQDFLPYYQGVLTIDGARGVTITGFTVQHGVDGITCKNGATCIIRNTTMQDNADEGLQVSNNAMAELLNCTFQRNAEWGLAVFDSSSVTFHGTIVSTNNGRAGIRIAGTSSASVPGEVTMYAKHNAHSGIEVVGASTFQAIGTLHIEHNGEHGVLVTGSSGLNGVRALFLVKHNKRAGFKVDGGAGISLGQVSDKAIITDNGTDIDLSFGARATLKGNTIGTITCDKSSLIRGDRVCPD
jgi:hypothetical protein